jgi:hypothetical protein
MENNNNKDAFDNTTHELTKKMVDSINRIDTEELLENPLPVGVQTDFFNNSGKSLVYSSIVGKWIDAETGEPFND